MSLVARQEPGTHHRTANDPGTRFGEGRYTALLDPALDMYAGYFSPDRPATWTPWQTP